MGGGDLIDSVGRFITFVAEWAHEIIDALFGRVCRLGRRHWQEGLFELTSGGWLSSAGL